MARRCRGARDTCGSRRPVAWPPCPPWLPFGSGQGVVQGLHIGQHQLDFDRLDVGDRVHCAGDVDDVGVLEAADHLEDGVNLANVAEEFVAAGRVLRWLL